MFKRAGQFGTSTDNSMSILSRLFLGVLCLCVIVLTQAAIIKYFKIDRLNNCEPMEEFVVQTRPNYTFTINPNQNVFNCTLRVTEEIEGPLQYKASIRRCEMDLSKCEFFNTLETSKLCEQFEDPAFASRFLNGVSQPLACPIQPGDYEFTNTKWDMSEIVNLPGSGYRWNITLRVIQLETGRVVYCQEMMSRIVVVRKKGNRVKNSVL